MSAYQGLRVLDFTQGVAGPMATMLLGDFGAEVIKVEPPGGDRLKAHPGYQVWNRNKGVLTAELTEPSLKALIEQADIVVFDRAPGQLEALGLDAETLTTRHPRLIHVWMPPFGTQGVWSQLPPRHNLASALTGMAYRQGAYEDVPIHLVLPIIWYGQAVMGASAMGSALLERSRSGRGQGVIVSGLNGFSQVTGPVNVKAAGPLPRGAPRGASPNYRLYECADGQWLFLATLFMNFFRLALDVFGCPERFDEFVANPVVARETLEAIFKQQPRAAWLDRLRAAGVPTAPVGPREDWFTSEVIAEAGLRRTFIHPDLGEVAIPGLPLKLSATPAAIRGLASPSELPTWSHRAATTQSSKTRSKAPLEGIRVLDLGSVIAGAHAGGVLANLGADVIKIEPAEGDPFRSDGGPFLFCSRGKRALGIDLKQESAKALFFDLASGADVVLDNYRLGVRDRLGIGYEALKAINPRIVSCSINAYGATGSRSTRPGFDPLLQAEGGMMAAQGGNDEPILHTMAVNDVATAGIVAFGIITALNAREVTGRGQEVLTSLMAQSLTYQMGEVVSYGGRPPNDLGGRDCTGVRALERYYSCADGWIALSCETLDEAKEALKFLAIEVVDLAASLSATRDGDLSHKIAAALANQPRDATALALWASGVPAAPVHVGPEVFNNGWLRENGLFEDWQHGRLGAIQSVRSYADFSATPSGFKYPTPDLGEHSVEILLELGYTRDRIQHLLDSGAIFEPATSRAPITDSGTALATQ